MYSSMLFMLMWFIILAEQLASHEVLKELDGVKEWFLVGLYLGIPPEEMEKSTMRKDIIYKWFEMGKESCTWQKLIVALVGANELEIARKIASNYGKLSIYSVYDLCV